MATQIDHVERLGDFQFIIFRRSSVETNEAFPRSREEAVSLAASRTAYLRAWRDLEETLLLALHLHRVPCYLAPAKWRRY